MKRRFPDKKAYAKGTKTMKSKEMATTPVKEVFRSIVEGRAVLRITSDKVFYNPVQEFNRDLSIAVLSVFTEQYKSQILGTKRGGSNDENFLEEEKKVDITILEALSATGLRSIRYAKEVVDITKVIANDICEKAVKTIRDNVEFNVVDHIVETSHDDACMLMYKHRSKTQRFTAVDLDPYGSPTIFLDAAVQSVVDGGLLLVTATDMAVLCGNTPETCYTKYGAVSLRTKSCHEMALRILLQCIESHANRYGRYIVPMLSVSADFYIRVFVKVYSGAGPCKNTTSKLSMVFHCLGCDSTTLQPLGGFKPNPTEKRPDLMKSYLPPAPPVGQLCDVCNQKQRMGGPIWSAAIHDQDFVSRVLDLVESEPRRFGTAKRLQGVLSVIGEELDVPLYYTLDRVCATVHSGSVPMLSFRSAILNAGYDVSYSHANKQSIKTNAPKQFVWDVMRAWVIAQPVKNSKTEANPIAAHILSQPVSHEVSFAARKEANPDSRRERRTRFQYNPTPHWGPGYRSTINTTDNKMEKSKRNQNKRSKWPRYFKRQLSPPDNEEGSNKKPPQKMMLIDTTSEPDSDDGKEADEEPQVATTEPEPDTVDKADANVAIDEPKLENGNTQHESDATTTTKPTAETSNP